jgi:hypothetical protein
MVVCSKEISVFILCLNKYDFYYSYGLIRRSHWIGVGPAILAELR